MTTTLSTTSSAVIFALLISLTFSPAHALGSASTLATVSDPTTVCAIIAGEPHQRIECYIGAGEAFPIEPNVSFQAISGGRSFFCGLRSGGYSFLCWDSQFQSRRVYFNDTAPLRDLSVGDDQVCAIVNQSGIARCWWRGGGDKERDKYLSPPETERFSSITSGNGFSCGILKTNGLVRCWGISSSKAMDIASQFGQTSMHSLVAGDSHVCGLNSAGFLICRGRNDTGQLNVPKTSSTSAPFGFSGLALGVNHSCAIRRWNGTVVCWGESRFSNKWLEVLSFQSIVAGWSFTCGLMTTNLLVFCWGPGWSMNPNPSLNLPLPKAIPGPCTQASCGRCGIYPDSDTLCSGSGYICDCDHDFPLAPPRLSPSPPNSLFWWLMHKKGFLVYSIVGIVGVLSGVCTLLYCIWTGICCCRRKKIHNSVQPRIHGGNGSASGGMSSGRFTPGFSRSSTIRQQSSRAMRRQRSGTSSKHADRAEQFTLSELAFATNNFSSDNKIGSGSFGIVYKGMLPDGREVAIKRGETGPKSRKFQEKESAFQSEIAFLSRLHHKHLVGLVGFCEEKEERLLVYEYMKNGALYDHLHSTTNTDKTSSLLNSWKMRIKVSLDTARGIEYLHNYAVPPIIHRDIKSSNILLDANWTARVSDFGLSLLDPESELEHIPSKAAGTVGYMDPEYYGLNVLTAKSDVYGLGVVLLELLTGKRAIFRNEDGGGSPVSVVDFAVQRIMAGELEKVLDPRVGPPEVKEGEAVELVAYTAVHCVNMEGRERPTTIDIVANLERAHAICDESHGSISSATFSLASE